MLRQYLAAGLVLVMSVVLLGFGSLPSARGDSRPADPDDPATPVTVTADELPTPQINGVVWSMAMAGDIVYVGGSFSNARPAGSAAGQNTVPRANMMAFNVTTGQMTSFAPTFNQQVRTVAVSPNGSRLYVGGEFTSVNGQARQRIAAFDTATGALVQSFAPPVNYHVRAIVATNTTVYVGGNFTGIGSVSRGRLAAFNASNGALLDWAPQATGGIVDAITINPAGTKVAVGGGFTALNGSSNPGYGLGMVDAVSGANLPFEANEHVRNGTSDGAIDTLATDGTYIYGGGWTFGKAGGSWEGVFAASWDDGKVHWLNDCHGDTYGVYPIGDVIYVANHAHYCENIDGMRQGAGGVGSYPYHRAVAFGRDPIGTVSWEPDQRRYYDFEGQPHSAHLGWFPNINTGTYTGQYQGPWSVVGNSDYVVFGGEFTRVNGTNQQGLTRFTTADKAANKKGPSLFNATYPLNVTSTEAGKVRVNWRTNQDIDNENLTYRVYRDSQNGSGLVHTRTVEARYWNPYTMGFTDTGLTPGSTHRYRVAVTDPFGNIANSPWTNITVASSGTNSDYVEAVYANEPTHYWRMGETSGATIADTVGFEPLTTFAGVSLGVPGGIAGDGGTAGRFSGTTSGVAATAVQGHPPDVFTLETWFKTTTTQGGRIVGWSNRNTDRNSSKHDRQLYMDNSGRIHFGTKPNASRLVVSSTGTYNDGDWHHAVATLSKNGMSLYLDGERVASRADVTVGEHLALGYWRVGGDTVSGWPSAPSSGYFAGDIDEVAVYKTALTAADVATHYAAATGSEPPNVSPVAAFDVETDELSVTVDGSGSSDPDGTVVSYEWDFGDGGGATGVQAVHTYAAPGVYEITLTVTDDDGATRSVTKQVTVTTTPNISPVASFTATPNGLSLGVDGSASTDPDGTITSYEWAFGDGGTATGATASHAYAEAGTYEVTLTVTDDDGATSSSSQEVSVNEDAVPIALDAFGRSVANGWGSADLGGVWSRSGSVSNFSVVDGVGGIRMSSPGAGPGMRLTDIASADTDLRIRLGANKAATGGGMYFTVAPRYVSDGHRYQANVRLMANGGVQVIASRVVDGSETILQSSVVTGLTVQPGELLHVRTQAFGTSPTTLRAKVWGTDTPEPEEWTVSTTDATTPLQTAGGVSLRAYLSGSATDAPVEGLFDDLWAGATGSEPPNVSPVAAFDVETDELSVTVDGSGSSDPDGTVVSYEWDFGDGGGATGVQAVHTYAAPGVYEITLTVTDDDGATRSVTREVTVTADSNVAPVASFTTSSNGLVLEVDGSASTDPDGSIASYEWDFGDGGTASGPTASHTYAGGGTFEVTLTVTDDRGTSDSTTNEVSVGVANISPVASFTATPNGLSLGVDGSASTDPDGTITSYEWAFGDGGTATGATASHAYAEAGTYEVTLTVTDDDGATSSSSQEVSVNEDVVPIALDAFGRSVANGWGSADLGGAWSRIGSASNFSVEDGVGRIRMGSPGAGPGMQLTAVDSTDTDLRVRVGSDKAATGGGTYLTVQPRVLPNGDRYYVDVRLLSTGGAIAIVGRTVANVPTILGAESIAGLTVQPGELFHVRTQAFGTSPTTLRAKVWAAGTAEPDAWTVSVTDSTTELQAAGGVGLRTYLSGSSTNAPALALFGDLSVGAAQ